GAGAMINVANNGREAVTILSDGPQPPPFDVVLMDLQMPEMDGYQATAKLRSDARFHSLPIIAMTAHATIEERQRCLAAGMGDHISKPIDPASLFETVGRFYKTSQTPSQPERSHPPQAKGEADLPVIPGLDTKDGLARVAGNRKLYAKLLGQFRDQNGETISQISAALSQNDTTLAERLAHTLKGVAGNIGAKPVQAAAGKLEKLISDHAKTEELESAKQQVAAVLAPLLTELQRAFTQGKPQIAAQPAPAAVDITQARKTATQLLKLLTEFDPGAVDFLETNQAVLRVLFTAEAWEQLRKQVQIYAFQECRALVEQAI